VVEERRSKTGSFKLIFCIVQEDDANVFRHALGQEDFESTVMSSTGGFLRSANITLLIGVESWRLAHALSVIRQVAHSREVAGIRNRRDANRIGAAIVFVLDVEGYHRI
jgi:uncharacterized protein YaaQ